MRILVTGGSGFLGGAVVPRLAREHDVVGLAHTRSATALRRCDIRDADALRTVLDEVRPDAVVHLAAYRDPDFCETHPAETLRLNVAPTETLAEHLPDATRILFVSTDYAFDGMRPPYAETDEPAPVNRYGASKVASERAVLRRPGSLVLRVPLLVGAGPSLAQSGFIGQLVAAVRGSEPQAVDDVLVRFPTWIGDVAEAIAFLLARPADGIYHLSGPRGATRYAWTREVAEILGRDAGHCAPSATIIPRPAARPPDSQLADPRIHAAGFPPSTDFADVVRSVLRAFPPL